MLLQPVFSTLKAQTCKVTFLNLMPSPKLLILQGLLLENVFFSSNFGEIYDILNNFYL